jgi:adenine phosphoribosyltransferase
MSQLADTISQTIRDVPDFPIEGIIFKDITPVLADPRLMMGITGHFAKIYKSKNIDVVVGVESRGFIFGVPIALALNAAFVPARKPGKLPYEHITEEYELEYGTAKLQMHTDAIREGQRVLVVDDLLATGGTAKATCSLVERLGGEVVSCAFVVHLKFLSGEEKLDGIDIQSIAVY